MSTMPIRFPPRIEAEVFFRAMSSGRNRALLIGGRHADGSLIECVAKLPGLMENGIALHPLPSLLEWLGSVLAAELGICTPDPYELVVTREFASVIADTTLRAGVSRVLGSVFASAFVRGTPMVAGELVDPTLRSEARELMAFDAYIHNADRRAVNPNVFLRRDEIVAFDHGDAFSFIWPLIGAPDPVTDPLLSMLEKHAFAACARRRTPPDLATFRARLAALSDARFDEIEAATPVAWQVGPAQGKLRIILDTLRQRRDAVQAWLPQVEAWMQS